MNLVKFRGEIRKKSQLIDFPGFSASVDTLHKHDCVQTSQISTILNSIQ